MINNEYFLASSVAKSSSSSSSAKSSAAKSEDAKDEDKDVQDALDASRRASIIASSNIHPSDGDDEGNTFCLPFYRGVTYYFSDGSRGSASSKSNSSMASNRSRLSSGSKASSLTAARNSAAKKTPKPDDKKVMYYDVMHFGYVILV